MMTITRCVAMLTMSSILKIIITAVEAPLLASEMTLDEKDTKNTMLAIMRRCPRLGAPTHCEVRHPLRRPNGLALVAVRVSRPVWPRPKRKRKRNRLRWMIYWATGELIPVSGARLRWERLRRRLYRRWLRRALMTVRSLFSFSESVGRDVLILSLAGDDFDDFQSAPMSPPVAPPSFSQTPAQAQKPTNSKPNVFEFLNQTQTPVAAAAMLSRTQTQPQTQPGWQQPPIQAQPARPNYYGGMGGVGGTAGNNPVSPVRSSFTGVTGTGTPMSGATRPPAASAGTGKPSANFDDLWSLGLGASKKAASTGATDTTTSKSMKDIEKEKAQAGIWGASQGQGHANQGSVSAFGSFGGSSAGVTSVGGGDDLLL